MPGVLVLFILIVLIYVLSYYIYKTYIYFPPIKIEQLRNKRVIITGASRGIGEELAYEYSRYNCRLILAARSIDVLKNQIAEKCRHFGATEVQCVQFDASTEEACNELISKTVEYYQGVDILILNHTAAVYEPFFKSDIPTNIKNMKKCFDTNFFGYFYTSKKIKI
jgi:short-subunit dehydrogenase